MAIKMKSEKSVGLKSKAKKEATPSLKNGAVKSQPKAEKEVKKTSLKSPKMKKVKKVEQKGEVASPKDPEKKIDKKSGKGVAKSPEKKKVAQKGGVTTPKEKKNDKKAALQNKVKTKKDVAKGGFQVLKGPDGKPLSKQEARKVQKKLKEERRKKKSESVFVTGVEAKKIWEELRREDCPKEKQVIKVYEFSLLTRVIYLLESSSCR